MEVEIKAEARSKALNNAVAITVVALSMIMAVSKIKDDNIVQAMQAAKADALDTWNEYQAERLKMHLSEDAALIVRMQGATVLPDDIKAKVEDVEKKAARYDAASKELADKAKAFQATYDALNTRDDQFDLSDAGLAISLSLAAVASLTDLWWLLGVSWVFGFFGALMSAAGFLQWSIHPDWLVALLT